jgi:hypothetical protein
LKRLFAYPLRNNHLAFSEKGDKEPKEDKNGEQKVPPGFEKFLKRSKREESSKEEEKK